MKRAINYIKNPDKTELHLVGGKDCSPDTDLEGRAKKERAIEESKGRGLDWKNGKSM